MVLTDSSSVKVVLSCTVDAEYIVVADGVSYVSQILTEVLIVMLFEVLMEEVKEVLF